MYGSTPFLSSHRAPKSGPPKPAPGIPARALAVARASGTAEAPSLFDAQRPRPSARSSIAGPGRRGTARARAQEAIDAAGKPSFTAQGESPAYLLLRRALHEFLDGIEIGMAFQAADFDRWLIPGSHRRSGCSFSPPGGGWGALERRATGALFKSLMNAGCLVVIDHRCTGGSSHAHSTLRPVYRLVRRPAPAPCESAA